jgi:hypothetical protein
MEMMKNIIKKKKSNSTPGKKLLLSSIPWLHIYGHSSSKTTQIYTHVSHLHIGKAKAAQPYHYLNVPTQDRAKQRGETPIFIKSFTKVSHLSMDKAKISAPNLDFSILD